jgi:uncharacterized lipoprotein YmbA
MRVLFAIITLFLVSCSAPKSYILDNKNIKVSNKAFSKSIGVKTIELPQYLLTKEIPFLKDDNQLTYLKDKKWATYLDEHLTNRVVSTLQKAFNTPRVYKYPQNTSTKPDIILQININKFIANSKEVILDATCQRDGKNRLFATKEKIDTKEDIVDGMNRAFSSLERKLIEGL